MKRAATCIRSRAEEIIENTLQQVDADAFANEVRALLASVADTLEGGAMPPEFPLRAKVPEPHAFVRILCAAQAAIIEVLRPELGDKDLPDIVLAMREVFDAITPSLPLMAPCEPLRKLLDEGPGEEPGHQCEQMWTLLQGVLTTMNDMVYAHDADGALFFINEPGLKLLKYDKGGFRPGLSIYQFVVPDYADLVEARLESPGAAIRSPYSIEVYARDGARVPIEIDTRPLFGPGGEVIAVVGAARDLVIERRLQEAMSEANISLENLVESLPIGVVLTDPEGQIMNANQTAAAMLGVRDVNALLGESALDLWGGVESSLGAALKDAVKTGGHMRERFIGNTSHGAPLKCDVLAQPLGQHAAVHGHLLLIIDVTEQLELQRSLMQTEKLYTLGELIAGVAHELNNPLTGIMGYTELLMRKDLAPEVRERLAQIVEEAERCKRIVENLLSFGSQREAQKNVYDINQLLGETLQLREYQLRVGGIDIETDFDPAIPPLLLDVNEMRRVFFYLINNAQQALDAKKDLPRRLLLATSVVDDKVHVRVEDNGPGVPSAIQSKIFDPFFTTRKLGEATGLGLSVSYGIVKEHGGSIVMESEEGKGASFTVILPLPTNNAQG